MHDRLFEHQQQLAPEDLRDHAAALALDLAQFAADFRSDAVARRIEADIRSGTASGVPGTPAFFVNGVLHEGGFDPRASRPRSAPERTRMADNTAGAAGTIDVGGDLTVNRLGFGAMRITGDGIWGEPPDRDDARSRCSGARSSAA